MKKYWISILTAVMGICMAGRASLVAHYTFDNAADIGHDDSGNGRNLTVYGVAADYSSQGFTNGAAVFDGSTQGFYTPTGILPAGSFSVAVWLKADTWGNTSYITRPLSATGGFQLYGAWTTEYAFATLASTGATYARPRYVTAVDQWQHMALTFEAGGIADGNGDYTGTLKGYIDGDLLVTVENAKYNASTAIKLCIGRYGTSYYDGMLDDYRLYNEALTGEQVALLAVPEPATIGLFGSAAAVLLMLRRCRNS